jgi:hypothetical protein
MNLFTRTIDGVEEGGRLLDESSNLLKAAEEAESLLEVFELTLQALEMDLRALTIMCEATAQQKEKIEVLRQHVLKELDELDVGLLESKTLEISKIKKRK